MLLTNGLLLAFLLSATAGPLAAAAAQATGDIPAPPREFRGVWVATVANIDWPSKPGLPVAQQKAELLAILDKAAEMNLNAIVFQVRPACDAMYDSKLEPWSEYLTGEMGKAPAPYYDPLAFAVEEAHKRGLELHCWFNPYRAHHADSKAAISADHISKTHPELVKKYGKYLWMDPGEKGTQEHSLAVMMDVVKRYDVDGVHIDDYFYPYRVKDESGKILDFPDDPSWNAYKASGGTLARDDWRRENVNTFIKTVYTSIKAAKPWVKFGISPFGMYRPGYPEQIKGFDQYSELYADARKWMNEGWMDYWTPQLYWKIDQVAQSYPVLLKWWVGETKHGRNLWPGNYTSRVGGDDGASAWPASEIVNQIEVTRKTTGASGNVHFSMKAFMDNSGGLDDALKAGPYSHKALVPASAWLDNQPPAAPTLKVGQMIDATSVTLKWKDGGKETAWQWVLYTKRGGKWNYEILPAQEVSRTMERSGLEGVAVSAVDRCGNESERTVRTF